MWYSKVLLISYAWFSNPHLAIEMAMWIALDNEMWSEVTQSKKALVQKCHESAWDTLHFIFSLPQWPAYSRKWLLCQPMFQNENDSEQRFQLAWIGLLTLKSKTDSYFTSKSGFIQKQQRIAIWSKQASCYKTTGMSREQRRGDSSTEDSRELEVFF